MDTKSKNSRKFGILILILLLAASSAVMMLQYGTIRRQIESVQEEGSRSGETAADMANTLAEGNYLLYNRYVRDTDPAEVLSLYGQQRFDLAEKYLDYELIDSKDEVIASDLPEEEQEKLHEDGKEYAFRVKYIFSENGDKLNMPCGVRDKFFLNPHFVIRDAGTLRWFAGLPAAVCGWTLEAIKPDRGDPPVQNGAGFDGANTTAAGHLFIFPRIAQNYVFIFYVSLDEKNVHFVRDSCKIFLQTKLPFGSCNVVLRARAVRSPLSGR